MGWGCVPVYDSGCTTHVGHTHTHTNSPPPPFTTNPPTRTPQRRHHRPRRGLGQVRGGEGVAGLAPFGAQPRGEEERALGPLNLPVSRVFERQSFFFPLVLVSHVGRVGGARRCCVRGSFGEVRGGGGSIGGGMLDLEGGRAAAAYSTCWVVVVLAFSMSACLPLLSFPAPRPCCPVSFWPQRLPSLLVSYNVIVDF